MPAFRNIGGSWKSAVLWRNIAGTWKTGVLWRNIAGVWKIVAGQISVTALPNPVNTTSSSSPVFGSTTAYGSGGSGSYSYAWVFSFGNTMTLTNANTATPTFSAVMGSGQSRAATFQCTATDTVTGQTASVSVDVFLDRI